MVSIHRCARHSVRMQDPVMVTTYCCLQCWRRMSQRIPAKVEQVHLGVETQCFRKQRRSYRTQQRSSHGNLITDVYVVL